MLNVNLTDRTIPILLNPTISSSTTKLPTDFIYSVRSENDSCLEKARNSKEFDRFFNNLNDIFDSHWKQRLQKQKQKQKLPILSRPDLKIIYNNDQSEMKMNDGIDVPKISVKNNNNWLLDSQFVEIKCKYNIADQLINWSEQDIELWFEWAKKEFKLKGLDDTAWSLNGQQLYDMDFAIFNNKMPNRTNAQFWKHIQILQCSNLVTIPFHKPTQNHLGWNGNIQLWQFLLELLEKPEFKSIIKWIDGEEFKFVSPEEVAELWGERKNNRTKMTYKKMSRVLRYYYKGNILAKGSTKFHYKFVNDVNKLKEFSKILHSKGVERTRLKHFTLN